MFMGEYNHSIDAKGRMIVPAKFREQLGNEFVVTKGLDGCLFVYSNEEWHRIEENLRDKPLTSREARKFMRFFFAGAACPGFGRFAPYLERLCVRPATPAVSNVPRTMW